MSTREKTTIQIDKELQTRLQTMMHLGDTYNKLIRDILLNKQQEIYVEIILVDNELPQSHTVILQIGEDKRNLYHYTGEKINPIELDEVQKLLKQPKPNMTITREDAKLILDCCSIVEYPEKKVEKWSDNIIERLEKFLEQT